MKEYKAIVWERDSERVGQRVSILAENSIEAQRQLKKEYGDNTIITLHNEDEAKQIRS